MENKFYKKLCELYSFDYIIEEKQGRDFVEYIVCIGGDIEKHRIYEGDLK